MKFNYTRLTLLLAICVSFLLPACSSNSANGPMTAEESSSTQQAQVSPISMYQARFGDYTVGESNIALDRSDRDIPLKVYYPQGSGPFPTIIFAHGTGASKDDYSALGKYWASHGYVSIHPTYADSLSSESGQPDRGDFREKLQEILDNPEMWVERVEDTQAVIEALSAIGQETPSLQGKINPQRIGVGGHSYGAYTAQLIGGATINLPQQKAETNLHDPRVKAVLLLSPQGSGQQGLTASSWQNFQTPMMVMTGSRDQGAQGQGPEWKTEPFELAPPGDKYLVFIEKANHFSFSGRLAQRNQRRLGRVLLGDQEAIFSDVKVASLAFWDAYLKQESAGQTYLNNQSLEQASEGRVSISSK